MEPTAPRAVHPPDKMASVRITKRFTYKGVDRHFSNRYHIGVNFPQSPAAWDLLIGHIMIGEQKIYRPLAQGGAEIIMGEGLGPNSNIPLRVYEAVIDGSLFVDTSHHVTPGDTAVLVRFHTPDRSVKNHPVYLYSYYHTPTVVAGGVDTIAPDHLAAITTYCNEWMTGFDDGVTSYRRSRPNSGTLVDSFNVKPEITHRDLPRS
jgi:hypothetical protein